MPVKQPRLDWNMRSFDATRFFRSKLEPAYLTDLGALYAGDCLPVLKSMHDECADTVFADPPFNIGKIYRSATNDSRPDTEYAAWCRKWLDECVRILKPGGSIFIYNLPRWNVQLGAYLSGLGLDFRHWIAIEMSHRMPIVGRLHPSHYSLIYYSKGTPKTFQRIRTPIQLCRHCGKEVRDYGGHRDAMNPNGVTLKDVWTDIPSVRHWKYKSKNRNANALSTKILDRVVEMSTLPGDLVVDPFGGSGTTFVVCESRNRKWIGAEIDYIDDIIDRLNNDDIHPHKNNDFVECC